MFKDSSAPGLLDSYEAERRPIGQQIVERTTKRMNKMFEGKMDEREPIREDSQLFLNYRGSALVASETAAAESAVRPLAGDRAPDVNGLQRFIRALRLPLV